MNAAAMRSTAKALDAVKAKFVALSAGIAAILAGVIAILVVSAGPAEALPAYARQTGQPCAACHTAFPELTPFGRRFKIGGYTLQGGDWNGPPLSAIFMAGFTHTNSPQDAPPAPGLHTNDNLVWQQVSGFIAGRLYGNLGSFIQITGDPVGGTARSTGRICATPIRSSCSGRTRSGASTSITPRPSKTRGTQRPLGAGRRFPRPSRRLSVRPRRASRAATPRPSAASGPTFSGTTCSMRR